MNLAFAYDAAGVHYDPSEHEDRFAPKETAEDQTQEPEEEAVAEKTAPTVSISPNPANPSTTITYTLPGASRVKLDVYAVSGQKVATLVDDRVSAGTHTVVFDGSSVASGVYLYRFRAGGFAKTGKILLVK